MFSLTLPRLLSYLIFSMVFMSFTMKVYNNAFGKLSENEEFDFSSPSLLTPPSVYEDQMCFSLDLNFGPDSKKL